MKSTIQSFPCILLWLYFVFTTVSAQDIKYKICATDGLKQACQQLARDLTIACKENLNGVDCLLNIQNEISHVGRITGEEAFLGANLLSSDMMVLGEIKSPFPPSESVVLIKSSIPSSFSDLKGKKLCHPGYMHDRAVSKMLLKELELKVVDLDKDFCSVDNVTLVERHVRSLAQFFGDSCRPGSWTENDSLDQILKNKYPSLCKLCGTNGCNVEYIAPFNETLKCLVDKNADIAVTTLLEAQLFFNSSARNTNNYKYLCKDGLASSATVPCSWSNQLPDLIVTKRNIANDMSALLQGNLNTKIGSPNTRSVSSETMEQALTQILGLHKREKIQLFAERDYETISDYVKHRRDVPDFDKSKKCDTVLKWCTYSDNEQDKCKWLSQAALNYGIQPVVKCVRSISDDSELGCLNDIQKGDSDIVVSSADYGYLSLQKGLVSLAYPETDTRNLSVILAVTNSNYSVRSFNDLKKKRACIPEFGGKEFLTFVDVAKRQKAIQDKSCDYGKLLSDFVEDSCVPGVVDSKGRGSSDSVDKSKLCNNCVPVNMTSTARHCTADEINKYYGNEGALTCLIDNMGDFAIITRNDFNLNSTVLSNLWVLCRNGTLARYSGLNVDKDCALNVITSSEVVSKNDNPKNPDIILALEEFEKWFGQDLKKPFTLFDAFNGTMDLLFKDTTPGLNFDGNTEYIRNYKKLLEESKVCPEGPSSSVTVFVNANLVALSAIFLYFYF